MNKHPKILTLIICTYDRNDILAHCINALMSQSADIDQWDIIVVDNYDNDQNHEELMHLVSKCTNAKLIKEPISGLSIARNTGALDVNTPWLGYIDDDCLPASEFVEQAIDIIKTTGYDCFGGHISSWWHYDRPKWMNPSYGSKPRLSDQPIDLSEDYIWGGNMFYKTKPLLEVKGFDKDVGMNGKRIGFSAENRVQIKLRKAGYTVGYYPNLEIRHLVAKHKYNLKWHLKAAYAEGRDAITSFPDQYSVKAIFMDIVRIPFIKLKSTIHLLSDRDYYWQNWVLDVFKPFFKVVGKLNAIRVK